MKELLIGDCHFGIKSNSITWLNQQIDFFKKTVFNIIRTENLDRIVFLGDLTDIRYSINQQIGIELQNLIEELTNLFPKRIIFVAGNHDYYSPIEEFAKYNSYKLLFGNNFLKLHPNVKFITEEPFFEDGGLFLPWYWTENPDHFDDMLYRYDMKRDVKSIYCHADLTCWPGPRIGSLHGKPVFAGHIHYIVEDEIANLHNVGAVFPLTFNDVNQDRFIYIVEDGKITKRIKNDITFKFIRLFNEEIFTATEEVFTNSYVQFYISNSLINKAQYIDQIKLLKTTYIDSNIRIHAVDDEIISQSKDLVNINMNINQYIDENIPDYLEDKYVHIKNKIKNK